jgi:hypothetical protein
VGDGVEDAASPSTWPAQPVKKKMTAISEQSAEIFFMIFLGLSWCQLMHAPAVYDCWGGGLGRWV